MNDVVVNGNPIKVFDRVCRELERLPVHQREKLLQALEIKYAAQPRDFSGDSK